MSCQSKPHPFSWPQLLRWLCLPVTLPLLGLIILFTAATAVLTDLLKPLLADSTPSTDDPQLVFPDDDLFEYQYATEFDPQDDPWAQSLDDPAVVRLSRQLLEYTYQRQNAR